MNGKSRHKNGKWCHKKINEMLLVIVMGWDVAELDSLLKLNQL